MESSIIVQATPHGAAGDVAAPANALAQRRARRIALVVIVLPVLGVVAALALLWGRGVGWIDVALLVGMYTATMFGVGMGLHRHFAHGSFQTGRPLRILLAVLGSMAAQGPLYYWVAIHRRHHAHSDEPGDPHSPHWGHGDGWLETLRGAWHSHIGWMFNHELTDWPRYITDLLRDRTLFTINRLYFVWVALGLVVPTVLGGLLSGTWMGAFTGLLWGGFVRIFLVHHAAWSLGSVSHLFGTAPFETRDHSTNNLWTALPTFGESWHNNHHAFPYSAFHGLRWWQFDLNALAIRALERLGLVWNVKRPTPRLLREARKQSS